jgi:Ohr subfamily peroxiredoxin
MKELYTTSVGVAGGRDGAARSDDGRLAVGMAMPKELGGTGAGTNPEQLFAAGFAGCFASSVRFAARQLGLDAGEVEVDARVTLAAHDDGRFGLEAALDVRAPGLAGGDLDAVMAEARRICAYANATGGNVETTYVVNGR